MINLREKVAKIVEHKHFTNIVMTIIIINALVIGIETNHKIYLPNQVLFFKLELMFLWIFTIEIAMRLYARRPWYKFFTSGWNLFDFFIVAVGHIFIGGHLASIMRIVRVLRVLRAITILPSLQKLVAALFRTIPAIGNIMILLSIIFYVFAVAGTTLFRDISPEYFGSLGATFLTLFQVVTLESWASQVMRPILEDAPWAWTYFVGFVLLGTFVIINLFIGVIVNNVQEVATFCEKTGKSGQEIAAEEANVEEQSRQRIQDVQLEVRNLRLEIAEIKEMLRR